MSWIELPAHDDLPSWAYFYAAVLGWPVFPVRSRDKIPITDRSLGLVHGVKHASADPDQVMSWWWKHPDANIGLGCGELAVIDLDGEEGFKSFAQLDERRPTLTSITGGGGAHLVYAVPAMREVKNTASKLGESIDTRGTGGYIVLPPSIHSSGNRYRWQMWVSPEEAPEYMLVPLVTPGVATGRMVGSVPLNGGEGSQYGMRGMRAELEHVLKATKGNRNNALNVAALNIGSIVAGGHLVAEFAAESLRRAAYYCWEASGDTPPKGEIERTIESGMREGYMRPRNAKKER